MGDGKQAWNKGPAPFWAVTSLLPFYGVGRQIIYCLFLPHSLSITDICLQTFSAVKLWYQIYKNCKLIQPYFYVFSHDWSSGWPKRDQHVQKYHTWLSPISLHSSLQIKDCLLEEATQILLRRTPLILMMRHNRRALFFSLCAPAPTQGARLLKAPRKNIVENKQQNDQYAMKIKPVTSHAGNFPAMDDRAKRSNFSNHWLYAKHEFRSHTFCVRDSQNRNNTANKEREFCVLVKNTLVPNFNLEDIDSTACILQLL